MSYLFALFRCWTWRMAWRDVRPVRARFLLFALSISMGVAAMVAIGSVNRTLRRAIADQAKALVGADLVLTARAPFAGEAQALRQRLGGEQAEEISFTSMLGFPSGLTSESGRGTRLVNVRALTGGFPFYGRLETEPASAADSFRDGSGVLVEESVARQFGATVGTAVKLGTWETRIVGVLRKVPGDALGFNTLAPRVYLAGSALAQTGLLRGPALARYRVMFRLPAGTDAPGLVGRERAEFRRLQLEWDTVEKRELDLGRSLEQLNSLLNLVALVALLLGAVGIASAIHAHVRQRLSQVAVLRCLGAGRAGAAGIYLAQAAGLGMVGAVVGVGVGAWIPGLLAPLLARWLPVPLTVTFSPWSAGLAAGWGVMTALVFALLPLLAVRRVSPLAAIRGGVAEGPGTVDPARWAVLGLIALSVTGAAVSQTRHWYQGLGFAVGLGVAFGIFTATARLVMWLARRWVPEGLPFAWRQGLASLHRPQNRTTTLLVALGLGTFLLLTLQFMRTTLLHRLFPAETGPQPNLMLFDIQPDQRADVLAVLAEQNLPVVDEAPIVTMRLQSLNGRSIASLQAERAARELAKSSAGSNGVPSGRAERGDRGENSGPRRRRRGDRGEGDDGGPPGWALTREYRSTWRTNLVGSERITAGSFVPEVAPGTTPVPISFEVELARDLGLGLGLPLEFDVQGVPVPCVVASLREVEWRQVRPNFFVVFPAGALESAPAMHILATRTTNATATALLQRALFQRVPNVSSIDLGLVLETLDTVLSRVGAAIRVMVLFTLVTGLIVVAGAIVSGRGQRARESVLLRTLGASRGLVRRVWLAEYVVLGLMAAVVGISLALVAGWALARWVFEIGFGVPWTDVLVAMIAVPALTTILGLLSGRGLAEASPLEILRQEA